MFLNEAAWQAASGTLLSRIVGVLLRRIKFRFARSKLDLHPASVEELGRVKLISLRSRQVLNANKSEGNA